MEAIKNEEFETYWTETETYESLDSSKSEVFIPNQEVADECKNAVEIGG